jgi:hypothetical protein
MPLSDLIVQTANTLGMNPLDLATIISFETGGTFNPTQRGPTTQWGQHKGLIQWGEPQARQYGVDWNDPINSQLGPNGAIVRYFNSRGWQPGMDGLNAYSIVNAGSPGRFNASDTAAGGTWGTVRDKWERQMDDHRLKASNLLGGQFTPNMMGGGGRAPQLSMGEDVPGTGLSELFGGGTPSFQSVLPQQRSRQDDEAERTKRRRQALFGAGGLADVYG